MNRGRAPCISRRGEGKDLRVFLFLRNDKRNKLVASFTLVCRPRDSLQSFLRFSVSFLLPFSFFLFTTVSLPSPGNFPASFPPPHFYLFVFRFPSSDRNRAIEQRKCSISCRIRHGWLKSNFVRSRERGKPRPVCSTRLGSVDTSPMIRDYFSSVNFRPIENRL